VTERRRHAGHLADEWLQRAHRRHGRHQSGTGWQIKGSGDFNNDGKSDILWQHADGTAGIWLMDGMTVLNQGPVGTNPGPSWHVMGSGDYNNDQRSDILWQNDNGPGRLWFMNGLSMLKRRRRRLVQSRAGVAHHRVTARAASARRDGARRARRRSRSLSATRADATLGAESESRVCRAAGVGFLRMTELLFLRPSIASVIMRLAAAVSPRRAPSPTCPARDPAACAAPIVGFLDFFGRDPYTPRPIPYRQTP
jgi:hypothetical protein